MKLVRDKEAARFAPYDMVQYSRSMMLVVVGGDGECESGVVFQGWFAVSMAGGVQVGWNPTGRNALDHLRRAMLSRPRKGIVGLGVFPFDPVALRAISRPFGLVEQAKNA